MDLLEGEMLVTTVGGGASDCELVCQDTRFTFIVGYNDIVLFGWVNFKAKWNHIDMCTRSYVNVGTLNHGIPSCILKIHNFQCIAVTDATYA
ncbi:MAG: hypothetical protein WCF90_01140 [Methanomicrobiales archaeon]